MRCELARDSGVGNRGGDGGAVRVEPVEAAEVQPGEGYALWVFVAGRIGGREYDGFSGASGRARADCSEDEVTRSLRKWKR